MAPTQKQRSQEQAERVIDLRSEETRLVTDALDQAEDVDARRITVADVDGGIALDGAVASVTEAEIAVEIAEAAAGGEVKIVDRLRIDRGLRDAPDDATEREPALPAADEILVGDVDMLAGPQAKITDDAGRAFEEDEPWSPPEHAFIPPTAAEQHGHPGTRIPEATDDSDFEGDADPERTTSSAADLTQADLSAAGRGIQAPGLDPETATATSDSPDPPGTGT